MGYFTCIADAAFKTGPRGEPLFLLGGPFRNPIILADDQQRDRTYAKHLWVQRIFLSILILGQPVLFRMLPSITGKITGFFGYLAIVVMVQWAVQRVVFRAELTQCKRMNSRLSLTSYCQQFSDKHSSIGLGLGFVGCMIFVGCGIGGMLFASELGPRGIGLFCGLFFSVCGLGWGYALYLKDHPKLHGEQGALVDGD